MRFIRVFVMAVGVIGILVAITLLLGYFLYSLTPWIQAQMTPVTVTADAAKSYDDKIEALKKEIKEASAANQNKEVKLVLTEREVNSKLTELLAEAALPKNINKILINFREDQFLVDTTIDVPGLAAKIGLVGNIKIVNNQPKVIIQDLDIGKLIISNSTTRRAESLLDFAIKGYLPDIPMKITSVDIGKREITVTGATETAK